MKKLVNIITLLFLCIFMAVGKSFALQNSGLHLYKLNNGHTVIIDEIHNNPIVTVDIWIKTGSVNENEKNNGVSHFLEHLFFKGTAKHPNGETAMILENLGARLNASTGKDFTHYYVTAASKNADTAIELLSDMLLNPAIPQEEFEKEKKVVLEEIRRSNDDVGDKIFKNLTDMVFNGSTYSYETLGTTQSIENISRNDVFDYYKKYYTPQNMVTVIAGDVNPEKTLESVKTAFAEKNVKSARISANNQKIQKTDKKYIKIETGKYNSGYMLVGFKGTDIKNLKDNLALDIASVILAGDETSRLYKALKDKENLVTSVTSYHLSMKDTSIFVIDTNFAPQNYETVTKIVTDEIAKLLQNGITQEELDRAVKSYKRAYAFSKESVDEISSSVGYSQTIYGNLDYYTQYIQNLEKITAKDVLKAARKYLSEDKAAVSVVLPENSVSDNSVNSVETYKDIKKTVLNNGITLIAEQTDKNNIAAMSVFIKGGILKEPIAGISPLTDETIMKGTETRTAEQIINDMKDAGVEIQSSAGSDFFRLSLKSTAEDFDRGFEIFKDILQNASFNQDYVDKAKTDIIESIKSSRDSPSSVAFENMYAAVFKGHPYNNQGKVLEESIPKITRDEIVKYYKDNFVPQNMIVTIVGNFDFDAVKRKLETLSGKETKSDINSKMPRAKQFAKIETVKETKETDSSWLVMAWPASGINNEKDYASLKVINSILGGGLSSRLFQNMREKNPIAYEVNSTYPSRILDSYFALYIGTEAKNIPNAKNAFLYELNRLKTEPLSEEELKTAKEKIVGKYWLGIETNAEKANYLGMFETLGKGYKFLYNYPEEINSVTIQDIMNTANKYFNNNYVISTVIQKEINSEN